MLITLYPYHHYYTPTTPLPPLHLVNSSLLFIIIIVIIIIIIIWLIVKARWIAKRWPRWVVLVGVSLPPIHFQWPQLGLGAHLPPNKSLPSPHNPLLQLGSFWRSTESSSQQQILCSILHRFTIKQTAYRQFSSLFAVSIYLFLLLFLLLLFFCFFLCIVSWAVILHFRFLTKKWNASKRKKSIAELFWPKISNDWSGSLQNARLFQFCSVFFLIIINFLCIWEVFSRTPIIHCK